VCLLCGTFCPHSVFLCFVWIWEQTAIISLYSINWLVFITETKCVYCVVRTEFLHVINFNIVFGSAKQKKRLKQTYNTESRYGWRQFQSPPCALKFSSIWIFPSSLWYLHMQWSKKRLCSSSTFTLWQKKKKKKKGLKRKRTPQKYISYQKGEGKKFANIYQRHCKSS
jgi:hypothetical protein